jgi:hypothetical protein
LIQPLWYDDPNNKALGKVTWNKVVMFTRAPQPEKGSKFESRIRDLDEKYQVKRVDTSNF